MIDISVIIVNYKSKEKLISCLASLASENWGSLKYEIIVVENSSGNDLEDLKNIKLIKSRYNLGMGGGNNLGIKEAQGRYLLILNPDTKIVLGALSLMTKYLEEHSEVGILGPQLLNPNGTWQASCFHFPAWYIPILRRTFLGDYFRKTRDDFMMLNEEHDKIKEVDWLLGSCLFLRKKDFPGFDERYFMYFEDTDLCRQIKNSGQKVVYFPLARVIHDHARQSASYPWYLAPFKDRLAREHIKSWVKYFLKWDL